VGADERQPQAIRQIPKNRTKGKPDPALKEIRAQFANAKAAMRVRVPEGVA
jgi:hypothetical protein